MVHTSVQFTSEHYQQPAIVVSFSMRNVGTLRRFSTNRLKQSTKVPREWRTIFEDCMKKNSLSELDWYHVPPQKILDSNGLKILKNEFRGSMPLALSTLFPEVEWNPWEFKFQNVPQGYWKSIHNQRRFFDVLGNQLGILSLDDWYHMLSRKLLVEHGGGGILSTKSPVEALMACYPEHNWILWKFNTTTPGFWQSLENQRQFFDWLGKELGVKELDDWYQLKNHKTVLEHGGSFVQEFYRGSVTEALKVLYPEHKWVPWKFKITPSGFWKPIENQRKFFDWLGNELGVKQLDDWYSRLSYDVVSKNGGTGLLDNYYNGSSIKALMKCYPDHNWLPWKFNTTFRGFWQSIKNQRQFFDWLGAKLGVQQLDDWYSVLSIKSVEENGGLSILLLHGHSPIRALVASYPEHNWITWKFKMTTLGFWNSKENISQYLSELSEKLCIRTLDDWYRVDVFQFGAASLRVKYGGLYAILKQQFPHHPWDPSKFLMAKKTQRWLKLIVQKLYPSEEIIEDYLHPQAIFRMSKRPMQLDIYIPSMSLAFEYQGQQHFQDVSLFGTARQIQARDTEKRILCAEHNIKLIEVPFWWDRTQDSLQKLIDTQV